MAIVWYFLNDVRKINGTRRATIQLTENSFRSTAIICVSFFRKNQEKRKDEICYKCQMKKRESGFCCSYELW